VGLCLNRHSHLPARADALLACRAIKSSDVIRSYVGLLCIGKNDFEAISAHQGDTVFRKSLGIGCVPSPETLRQRLDQMPAPFLGAVADAATELIRRARAPITPLSTGHVALDCDATPLDNSGTRKEGVSYTYKGHEGYTPMGAYLAREGWCMELELRPGSQHAQNGFVPFLERVAFRARRLVGPRTPLLVRLDSAHDAAATLVALSDLDHTDWIVKWNPRKQDLPTLWKTVSELGTLTEDAKRPGRKSALFEEVLPVTHEGRTIEVRRIVRMVERTIDRKGQPLLLAEYELDGWWTSLELGADEVIRLYNDRGTAEQFHSELKSDLDIERLPSGKFATNALVLALAGLAYNILRLIGQIGLLGEFSPVRHPAKRRRLKTVMQELMYVAARMIHSGRRLRLRFAEHCAGFDAFRVVYAHLWNTARAAPA